MKKIILFAYVFLFCAFPSYAQTLSLDDGNILQANTKRIGINIDGQSFYGSNIKKRNLLARNPGFETALAKQIWVTSQSGTTTTFIGNNIYDDPPADFWTGATFELDRPTTSGEAQICAGTIAHNTANPYDGTSKVTYTFNDPCSSATAAGDVLIIRRTETATPEAVWEAGGNGIWSSVGNGGKLVSDTTDLCSVCGTQAISMDASVSGSTAGVVEFFDTDTRDIAVLMNGTFKLQFWAKAAVGSPTLAVTAMRPGGGSSNFSCGPYTIALTNTWTQYTETCTANESVATVVAQAPSVKWSVAGGTVYLDNVDFEKTGVDASNTTILRDEVIATLRKLKIGELRFWTSQNADEMVNLTAVDDFHRHPTNAGKSYLQNGGVNLGPYLGDVEFGLNDALKICKVLGVECYWVIPVTASVQDAKNFVDYVAGGSNTTYGALRSNQDGQVAPWTSFMNIHASLGNENWNDPSFAGQNIGYRQSAPGYYFDYAHRLQTVFPAMRAMADYPVSGLELVANVQTAITYASADVDSDLSMTEADAVEVNGYLSNEINNVSTTSDLWLPASAQPWANVHDPAARLKLLNSISDYSNITNPATGKSLRVNMYEFNVGAYSGKLTQALADGFIDGGMQGVIVANQALENVLFGIEDQNIFALGEYDNGAFMNGVNIDEHLWGIVIDMGGATNALRPQALGMILVNESLIGPEFSCPVTGSPTISIAADANNSYDQSNNDVHPVSNVPVLEAFCFMGDGVRAPATARSMVVINKDLSTAHTLSIGGTNPPSGDVTIRQFYPPALNSLNEAANQDSTIKATQTMVNTAVTTTSFASTQTFQPHSVTAFDWTASGTSTKTPQSITFPALAPMFVGGTQSLSATASSGLPVSYTVSGPGSISGTTLTATGAGTISVTATQSGNVTYAAASPVSQSTSVSTMNSGGLPAGWSDGDIGNPGVAGSASYANSVFTVTGSGSDIYGQTDQFNFARLSSSGGGQIVAYVALPSSNVSGSAVDYSAKGGVMFRNSTDPLASFALVDRTRVGIEFIVRTAQGGYASAISVNTSNSWVKLVRAGNSFTGYSSPDGNGWTQIGSSTVITDAGSTMLEGLAVTSHNNSEALAVNFANVAIGGLPSGWSDGDIGNPGIAGSALFANSIFTITGSGADIYAQTDQFNFARFSSPGNTQISADVVFPTANVSGTAVDYNAKGGVMLRNSIDPLASFALVDRTRVGVEFIVRTAQGVYANAVSVNTTDTWVKLVRTANSFTGYSSPDGSTWAQIGSPITITDVGTTMLEGLAVTSHNNAEALSINFANVSVVAP